MSEITLLSKELTFLECEFQKSDITSKDKLQNIVNEVVEDVVSNSTAHVVLGTIDAHNKNNLIEKYFTTESYDESDKGLSTVLD